MWGCVFSLPIPLVMIERIYIYILCLIIIIKSEVWTIAHCLGLGHESVVCAVCLSLFLCYIPCTHTCVYVIWNIKETNFIHMDSTGFEPMHLRNSFSMMTSSNGNIYRVTGHLCGEFTGHRWIPRTKASDAELWYFLWSALKLTIE